VFGLSNFLVNLVGLRWSFRRVVELGVLISRLRSLEDLRRLVSTDWLFTLLNFVSLLSLSINLSLGSLDLIVLGLKI
jgi:ABC-type bacteriocin/lantibiotic exporter with double-glycine peptidase domain